MLWVLKADLVSGEGWASTQKENLLQVIQRWNPSLVQEVCWELIVGGWDNT